MTTHAPPITAIVLAGGQGARMGGADKGLATFRGRPLVAHALDRLARQTVPPAAVLISANRNLARYRAFGLPVIADEAPAFAGPLAAFMAGLGHARTPLVLTVPCDVPRFPLSLCERLAQARQGLAADLVMAAAPDETGRLRPQPTFCLMRVELQGSLRAFLAGGGRKVGEWAATRQRVLVPFGRPDDDPHAFANANTPDELAALERLPDQPS